MKREKIIEKYGHVIHFFYTLGRRVFTHVCSVSVTLCNSVFHEPPAPHATGEFSQHVLQL